MLYNHLFMESSSPAPIESAQLDATFAALADPTRRAILSRLALVEGSVAALADHWGKMTRMYGAEGVLGAWVAALEGDGGLTHLKGNVVANVPALIASVLAMVAAGQPSGAA